MVRIAIVVFLLVVTGHSGSVPGSRESGIEVHLCLLREHGDTKDFEVTSSNKGRDQVYIMTKPQRSDRSTGPYFAVDEEDSALLRAEFRAYPPPQYDLYFNGAHVELNRLRPGEENREIFSVTVPVTRTVPPYGSEPSKPGVFGNRFRRIEAVVGILPATESLNKLMESKLGTHQINGLEPVAPENSNSLRIFEAQRLLTSNSIDF